MIILEAGKDFGKRIFLDGEDVSNDTFHALVPNEAGVEGFGTVGRYRRVVDNSGFVYDLDGRPIKYFTPGMVKWE